MIKMRCRISGALILLSCSEAVAVRRLLLRADSPAPDSRRNAMVRAEPEDASGSVSGEGESAAASSTSSASRLPEARAEPACCAAVDAEHTILPARDSEHVLDTAVVQAERRQHTGEHTRKHSPSRAPQDRMMLMINGLPGQMAAGVARVALDRGYAVAPTSLTGSRKKETSFSVIDERTGSAKLQVELYAADQHESGMARAKMSASREGKRLVVIDFTAPTAVRANAKLYANHLASFVLGTTGFDDAPGTVLGPSSTGKMTAREAFLEELRTSLLLRDQYAVIAPNMNKQIVAFQAMLSRAAQEFPGCFAGYELSVRESHQKTKKDTSGTAKEVVRDLRRLISGDQSHKESEKEKTHAQILGADVENIEKIRDDQRAREEMQVPESALCGHAFHTYQLTKKSIACDKVADVVFEFKHNVCGRQSYCEGAVDAAEWLLAKIEEKPEKRIFDMVDVLRGSEAGSGTGS
ncbi:unnamed protein product [Amoebophrya sp. A120]|nr:unnamed protein product [Amoebophrya sp. A120]|eukprot:GSA120T00006601001.1